MAAEEDYYNVRPYMTKLPQSRLRTLPAEKGSKAKRATDDGYGGPEVNILKLYGLDPVNIGYVRDQPRKDPDRLQWKDTDVNNVVDYYLKASTHGHGNPQQPQPSTMCECCMEINDSNKRGRMGSHQLPSNSLLLEEDEAHGYRKIPKPGSRPVSPEEAPTPTELNEPNKRKQVRFLGMGDGEKVIPAVPFYRTEHDGPELIIPDQGYVNDRGSPPPANSYGYKPDTRTVFVTHPAKKSLYSNWGLNEEVGGFSRDRYMAEDVVVASSNYIKSMERLKNYTN